MTRPWPFAALILLTNCDGTPDTPAMNASEANTPIAEVRVATAALGTTGDTIVAYGSTEAGPGAERSIVAPAEAIVGTVLAPTGTAVSAGAAVVKLLPSRTSRLDAARAASDARLATAALARAQRLRRDGLVSDADVETARAALATAQATIASIGIGGGGLTLRAPGAGTVQNLLAKPGDQVAAGTAIATVAGRGDVRARFGVDPAIARRIRSGQIARVQPLNSGSPVTAPIVGVDPAVDATTRLASVFVKLPGGLGLSPGEPLRATVQVGATTAGISVPYAALLDDGGRSYVFVVRDGVAKSVGVLPGNSSGDRVQIRQGLQPGDKVVVEGGTALEDGMKVRVAAAGK